MAGPWSSAASRAAASTASRSPTSLWLFARRCTQVGTGEIETAGQELRDHARQGVERRLNVLRPANVAAEFVCQPRLVLAREARRQPIRRLAQHVARAVAQGLAHRDRAFAEIGQRGEEFRVDVVRLQRGGSRRTRLDHQPRADR
jgi:hypothetical protein